MTIVRALTEPCPFCRQVAANLMRDDCDFFEPFYVLCGACRARGHQCDCGEESAVPAWLGVATTEPANCARSLTKP